MKVFRNIGAVQIAGLKLPDENHRHVFAAEPYACCDAITTFNMKDYPIDYLAKFQIEPVHPDDFLSHQLGFNSAAIIIAAKQCQTRFKNPTMSAAEYLDTLEKQGLPNTVAKFRHYSKVI